MNKSRPSEHPLQNVLPAQEIHDAAKFFWAKPASIVFGLAADSMIALNKLSSKLQVNKKYTLNQNPAEEDFDVKTQRAKLVYEIEKMKADLGLQNPLNYEKANQIKNNIKRATLKLKSIDNYLAEISVCEDAPDNSTAKKIIGIREKFNSFQLISPETRDFGKLVLLGSPFFLGPFILTAIQWKNYAGENKIDASENTAIQEVRKSTKAPNQVPKVNPAANPGNHRSNNQAHN
jgi:hypothetical protein